MKFDTIKEIRKNWLDRFNQALSDIDEGVEHKNVHDGLLIPYQFFVPLLASAYNSYLQAAKETGIVDADKASPPDTFVNTDLDKTPKLSVKNPGFEFAKETSPVRAIAYLSWEKETRISLIRRVYPTYFDMLAISHIPEGWGVIGKMLIDFENDQSVTLHSLENNLWFYQQELESNHELLPYALPYMADREKLKLKKIVIVPVLKKANTIEDSLIGTFWFFLGDLPKKEDGSQTEDPVWNKGVGWTETDKNSQVFVESITKAARDLVRKQEDTVKLSGFSLADKWSQIIEKNPKNDVTSEILIGQILLKGKNDDSKLRELIRSTQAKLSGIHFFSTRLEKSDLENKGLSWNCGIMAAPSPTLTKNINNKKNRAAWLESRLLDALLASIREVGINPEEIEARISINDKLEKELNKTTISIRLSNYVRANE